MVIGSTFNGTVFSSPFLAWKSCRQHILLFSNTWSLIVYSANRYTSEQLHPIQQANFLELQFSKCLISHVSYLPLSACRVQCFLSPFQKEFDVKLIQLKIWNPLENSTTVFQCLKLLYILFIKISDDGSLMVLRVTYSHHSLQSAGVFFPLKSHTPNLYSWIKWIVVVLLLLF